jgi:hypothetical protein
MLVPGGVVFSLALWESGGNPRYARHAIHVGRGEKSEQKSLEGFFSKKFSGSLSERGIYDGLTY